MLFNSPKTLSGVIEKKTKYLKELGVKENDIVCRFAKCHSLTDIEKVTNKIIFEKL